jgi:hypothetical protein
MPHESNTWKASALTMERQRARSDGHHATITPAFEMALLPLARRVIQGDQAAMRAIVDRVCAQFRIRLIFEPLKGGQARFVPSRRWSKPDESIGTIFCREVVDLETLAEFLHEAGHGITNGGRCPERGAHFQVVKDNAGYCLQCETDAWAAAQRLVPFSPDMFREVQHCLGSYRDVTPGTPAAREALAAMMSTKTYMANQLKRMTYRQRLERQAKAEAEVAAAKGSL